MRVREVWIHAVDLGTGATFSDIPQEALTRLVQEIWDLWSKRDQNTGLALRVEGAQRRSLGEAGDDVVVISGSLPAVTRWAAGRGEEPGAPVTARRGQHDVAVPEPPRWL